MIDVVFNIIVWEWILGMLVIGAIIVAMSSRR
jgi:hypothetical protein